MKIKRDKKKKKHVSLDSNFDIESLTMEKLDDLEDSPITVIRSLAGFLRSVMQQLNCDDEDGLDKVIENIKKDSREYIWMIEAKLLEAQMEAEIAKELSMELQESLDSILQKVKEPDDEAGSFHYRMPSKEEAMQIAAIANKALELDFVEPWGMVQRQLTMDEFFYCYVRSVFHEMKGEAEPREYFAKKVRDLSIALNLEQMIERWEVLERDFGSFGTKIPVEDGGCKECGLLFSSCTCNDPEVQVISDLQENKKED